MQRLTVALGSRSYDIVIGGGLLVQAGALMAPLLRQKRIVVVSDENVAKLHLPAFVAGCAASGIKAEPVILPPGEATKDFTHFQKLCEIVLGLGIERGTMLVALGGGVVGDLTGFAAATLLRGLDYIQVPTTLLAQVDSAVGGKTAIDTIHGKNLVGAFHQPVLVLADSDTLATLSRRELLAGYAEVVKYGLIRDKDFFAWLEQNGAALVRGDVVLRAEAVRRSCAAKAEVVAGDERETGERALLNLGHTFGHALEAETGFGASLLHGEGVAIGMRLAFDFSVRLGLCPAADAARMRRHFEAMGLPTAMPNLDPQAIFAQMRRDKKVMDGRISLILVRGIGQAFIERAVPPETLREFLSQEAKTLAPAARAH
ncbi:MAG TPA: 3-dehydroquinate synthase [Stellaceae bacterium]|jgi:3-dehydroquinate synthase|nr:3-dehydroquinate synthase [Stellaceae bacterium]